MSTNKQNIYQRGKIYKITDLAYTECYIGSTCQLYLSSRLAEHKGDYSKYKRGVRNLTASYLLFDKYGLDNCKIELIENYPCNSRDELLKREGEHIKNTNCVNKYVAGRTNKEYYKDNKDKLKEYYQEYRDTHKIEAIKYSKEYREQKKEIIKQKNKLYRETNKEIINEKSSKQIECECGSSVRYDSISKHKRSQKHRNYLNSL